MGLFSKKKEQKVLKQDLSQEEKNNGAFAFNLLFEEKCNMPSQQKITEVFEKHLGDIEFFTYNETLTGIMVKKYVAEFKEGKMPIQVLSTGCAEIKESKIDQMARTQMWNCPQSDDIIEKCKYQVIATDMMARVLPYKDRAQLAMDYMEALVELYPLCKAVFFQNSGKMYTREEIINHNIPKKDRFIHFAVNVRFFNIEGTEEMLVDTLGMDTLFLPDLQYHFKEMDPNWVVNHAYNVLSYIYDNDCTFKSGDTVDGVVDGKMSMDVQWKCQFEDSLIQPKRPLLDIEMGEFAGGNR